MARTIVIVIGVLILILVLLNFIGVIDGGPPRLLSPTEKAPVGCRGRLFIALLRGLLV